MMFKFTEEQYRHIFNYYFGKYHFVRFNDLSEAAKYQMMFTREARYQLLLLDIRQLLVKLKVKNQRSLGNDRRAG